MSKNATWREQRVTVNQGTIQEVNFQDTHPNYIYFANNSSYNLYVCASPLVSASLFDMIVPAYATKLWAREEGVNQIYIFNNSSLGDAAVAVVSFMAEFDAKNLPQTQEIVGASAAGLLGVIDINQINSALPAGTNTIGNVGLSAEIPAGTKIIGSVNIIFPQFLAKKMTLAAGVAAEVKATPGYIAKIKTALTDVVLLNDTTAIWEGMTSDTFSNPVYCNTKIMISSAAGGDVYVEYL